jgi:hypothetical protein
MSRFDRRLKGTGLRPGQSTCKIGREKQGGSPNVGQYATMSWNGNIVTGAPVPTYNPNVMVQQNSAVQQNSVVQQNNGMQLNNSTATVRVMDNNLGTQSQMNDLDALAVKNARLEEAEKTAPNQSMRLITRHEIRLNTLEALSLRMEHLDMIQNGCARMNSIDDRMIEDLKDSLWTQLQSRHDVEVQRVVMGLKDEVLDLKMKVEELQEQLGVKNEAEPVKKPSQITLNIEEATVQDDEMNEGTIKDVVAQAIASVEAGEA